jgi:glyoxylase-like metal-dependent hydrolase (beta-lactamase superfamily II)
MSCKKMITGMIQVNTYIIPNDNGDCLIIDPSDGCEEVLSYLQKENLRPLAILLTHGHFDHIMGIPEILDMYSDAKVYIHDNDKYMLGDPVINRSARRNIDFMYTGDIESLTEGKMSIGGFEFSVLHTPGHTQGGCVFVFDGVCFCGDTVFANSVGRSDFPNGDHDQLISSISEKIMTLPPQTTLCPGHGGSTTVEREKGSNPYLQDL